MTVSPTSIQAPTLRTMSPTAPASLACAAEASPAGSGDQVKLSGNATASPATSIPATARAADDRAASVALLPVFDPAIGGVLVMASIALAAGSTGPNAASLQPQLSALLGAQRAEIHYLLQPGSLTSVGRIGSTERDLPREANINERLEASGDNQAHLGGKVGTSNEDLTMSPSGAGFHIVGKVGGASVDVNYTLQPNLDASSARDGEYGWAAVEGTIDGLPYSASANLTPANLADTNMGSLAVHGTLGNQDIDKTYDVSAAPDGSTMIIDGNGTIAGRPQNIHLVMDMQGVKAFPWQV